MELPLQFFERLPLHLALRVVFWVTTPRALILHKNVCRKFHVRSPSWGIILVYVSLYEITFAMPSR